MGDLHTVWTANGVVRLLITAQSLCIQNIINRPVGVFDYFFCGDIFGFFLQILAISWSGIFGQRPTPLICSTTIIEAPNGIIVIVVLFFKPLRHTKWTYFWSYKLVSKPSPKSRRQPFFILFPGAEFLGKGFCY